MRSGGLSHVLTFLIASVVGLGLIGFMAMLASAV